MNVPPWGMLPVNEWQWAVVNNAAYEYYKMCEQTGIPKPPSKLKIMVLKSLTDSSTPMLRRINGLNNAIWLIFFIKINPNHINNPLIPLIIKTQLPDVTIGTQGHAYRRIYEDTNHELSHASHFRQVGSSYWTEYITYIVVNGAYGDENDNNAELCGLSEMWGYFMGHIQECENYNDTTKLNNLYADYWGGDWFKPDIFWDLYKDKILTKKEIYDCLTSDVDTFYKLIAKMYDKYPSKANAIDSAFVRYNIIQNVPKPTPPPLPPDNNFNNQNVTSNTVISGNIISTQNVTVSNNAKLTFNPGVSVTINTPFTVNSGSQLEISF